MKTRLLRWMADVRPGEGRALLWSFLCYFFLLSGYGILRPIREAAGIRGDVRDLPWIMQVAVLAMIVINPIYSALAARLPRRKLLPRIYHFAVINILIFFVVLEFGPQSETWGIWTGRVFYVWLTVMNLFLFSMFWSLTAERFDSKQSKRLFGVVAAGGSLGSTAGSSITAAFAESIGTNYLFLPAALLFECAVIAVYGLLRSSEEVPQEQRSGGVNDLQRDRPLGGSAWAGFREVLKSPYLLGITLYILLMTTSSTWIYFAQADIVSKFTEDSDTRTAIFARIDLATNILSLVLQLFVAGRVASRLGMGISLAALPLVSAISFVALRMSPSLMVVAVCQMLRRASNYGIAKPAREGLYTVVTPEQKYKSKNFIDAALYRGGDALGAEFTKYLNVAHLSISGAILSAGWILFSLFLGRGFTRRSDHNPNADAAADADALPPTG